LPQAQTAVVEAIRPGLQAKLSTLIELGLGHLTLARPSQSLSTGELQRLRLAGVLDSALTQLTLVLDEPGTGLDDARLEGLLKRLRAFCDQGNTVVMVCHRQVLIDGAASVLTLGPGPGEQGGRLIQAAPEVSFPTRPASPPGGRFQIRGARAHHLKGIDLDLPNRGLVAVTGPSGSGKSSLLFDVIAASAAAGRPQHCDAIDGLEHFAAVRSSRATPSRSPLSTLDLTKAVQALFHGVGSGLSRSAFSFHSPAGRCPACKGAGSLNVAMDFMADLSLDCASCGGQRYKPEVLAVNWRGMNVAEFLNAPVASLVPKLPAGALADAVTAMCGIGLGHLNLGRPPAMLSGGEHQRLLLASALAQPNGPSLFVLDEPGSGLHPQDLARLLEVLYALIEDGALVLMSTHRKRLVGGAHWQVDLGPGGGEDGGVLMAAGPR
ncbi:MAG: AAA family ATPase, partial [Proteobacteria bacterium]|nr:AAA family ATPase [Pseudomonadota bacterium]